MATEPPPDGQGLAGKTSKKRKKSNLTATIEVFQDQPDRSAPLVGYFPSGFDPTKDADAPSPRVSAFRNEKLTSRLNLVVSPPGSSVDFVGSSFKDEAAAVQPCTYALGVLDKETGTLKIVPIASNKILRMDPKAWTTVAEDEKSDLGDLSAKERLNKHRELTNLYGTKKSISKAKKLDALRVEEDDPASQNDIDGKMKDIKINKESLESSGKEILRNTPPYNLSATDPKEAYPLEKIILQGEWDYITDILKLVERGEELSPDAYPEFVRNRVYMLGDIKDKYERETLGCVLSYITHLVKFKDRFSAEGFKSAKNHKFPSIINQRFSSLFTVPESKLLPSEKIDLLISYILVLCLFVDNFQTDFTDIAGDLRTSPVFLRERFEHLGCKFSKLKGILYAKLPVPLNFPGLRQRRRR